MTLDYTAQEMNVYNSLRKFLIDNLHTTEGFYLSFDRILDAPKTGNNELDKWISVKINVIGRGLLSETTLELFCCTRQDPEKFKLIEMSDTVMSYLSDTDATDGMKRIDFYDTHEMPWINKGALCITEIRESNMETEDKTKIKLFMASLRWTAKV